jgi:hypothetical protein
MIPMLMHFVMLSYLMQAQILVKSETRRLQKPRKMALLARYCTINRAL